MGLPFGGLREAGLTMLDDDVTVSPELVEGSNRHYLIFLRSSAVNGGNVLRSYAKA